MLEGVGLRPHACVSLAGARCAGRDVEFSAFAIHPR